MRIYLLTVSLAFSTIFTIGCYEEPKQPALPDPNITVPDPSVSYDPKSFFQDVEGFECEMNISGEEESQSVFYRTITEEEKVETTYRFYSLTEGKDTAINGWYIDNLSVGAVIYNPENTEESLEAKTVAYNVNEKEASGSQLYFAKVVYSPTVNEFSVTFTEEIIGDSGIDSVKVVSEAIINNCVKAKRTVIF